MKTCFGNIDRIYKPLSDVSDKFSIMKEKNTTSWQKLNRGHPQALSQMGSEEDGVQVPLCERYERGCRQFGEMLHIYDLNDSWILSLALRPHAPNKKGNILVVTSRQPAIQWLLLTGWVHVTIFTGKMNDEPRPTGDHRSMR